MLSRQNVLFALSVVLVVAGLSLILIPSRVLAIFGMSLSGSTWIWVGLVGAGFATAGWLDFRIQQGVDAKRSVYEAHLAAALLALVVLLFNMGSGGIVLWLLPIAAALIVWVSWENLQKPV